MLAVSRTVRLVLPALLAAALGACASTTSVMMAPARPPIDPAQVQVYAVPPPGAQEIAQIETTSEISFGGTNQAQADQVVLQMKTAAAHIGANGVVLLGSGSTRGPGGMSVGVGSYGPGFGSSVGFGIPTAQKKATGIAIWVPDGVTAPILVPAQAPSVPPMPQPAPVTQPTP